MAATVLCGAQSLLVGAQPPSTPVFFWLVPKLLHIDFIRNPDAVDKLAALVKSPPFAIPTSLSSSQISSDCLLNVTTANIDRSTWNIYFGYHVQCQSALHLAPRTCLTATLVHDRRLPFQTAFNLDLIYGRVPHGCPDGKEMLAYHETNSRRVFGVYKSTLLDASCLRLFKDKIADSEDLVVPFVRSSVLNVLLASEMPRSYVSYYSKYG